MGSKKEVSYFNHCKSRRVVLDMVVSCNHRSKRNFTRVKEYIMHATVKQRLLYDIEEQQMNLKSSPAPVIFDRRN
jgi:hypothetical protein